MTSRPADSGPPAGGHGLFVLHPPKDLYEPKKYDVDIVAIHGLQGTAEKTWTDSHNHLWLRDSLPGHVPNVRILTYGYDSSLFFSTSQMAVHDFARDLFERLQYLRQHVHEKKRPLIFICHSLGGVVFKELLVQVSLDKRKSPAMADCISGVVFMGTPHRGSRVASPASILAKIVNVATFGVGVRSALLKLLQVSSVELESISRHAAYLLGDVDVVSFYEQKPLGPSLIVEPFSAVLGLPNERAIPINADHRELARLSPRVPNSYLPVWSAVKELVEASRSKTLSGNQVLLNGLFCVDYKAAQLRPRQARPETCEWVFSDITFTSWLNSGRSSMLALSGPPGSGKSVLTRHIAEAIISGGDGNDLSDSNLAMTFFCSYTEQASNSEESVLRSMLHQAILLNPYSANIIRNRLERTAGADTISVEKQDLWLALEEVILMDSMKNIRIFVDAVDELGVAAAQSLSSGLYSLIQRTNTSRPTHRLRIFISRRYPLTANPDPLSLFTLKLSKLTVSANIKAYVHSSIEGLASVDSMFRATLDLPTRHRIENHITQRADGMFLWAQIAWDDFRKGILWNKSVLDQKLKKLDASPSGLDQLYKTILQAIDDESREDAMDIFCLISVSARPLKEHELGILLGMCRRGSNIQTSSDFDTFPHLGDMLGTRFPELIIIHDDDTITFAHLSFREYLHATWDSLGSQRLNQAKRKIAEACLQYIMLEDLIADASGGKTREELLDSYPLLPYAVEFLLHHVAPLRHSDPLWLLFAKTAKPLSIYTIESLRPNDFSIMTPLRVVLDEVPMPGKRTLIKKFSDAGYDMDESWLPRLQRGYALSYCTRKAKSDATMEQMALLLLELGANPNLPEEPLVSNFRSTIERGLWDLYDALLQHPWIDLDAIDFYGQTIVHNLVQFGPQERLSHLLDHRRIDVNIRDCNWFTPIHLATSLAKPDAVRKLLTVRGVRLDLMDKSGRTPLTLATYWGLQNIALIMIENSQAFPISDNDKLSSITFAAKHGQEELCFRLLAMIEYKGLNSHIDHSGKGILHHAAINDWHGLIRQCFQKGDGRMNVNQIDYSGKSALHYAAALGNTSSCLALLENGASTRLQDRIGRTAPQAAADAGFKDSLVALLMHGDVDPNQRDIEGRNLVHWTATLDCLDVVQQLAAVPGVELARRDKHGKMPIDIAYICKCPNVGRYLSSQMRALGLAGAFTDAYYGWDGMYNSATVDYMDIDDEGRDEYPGAHRGIIERHAMNQERDEAAHKRWEGIQRQYPSKNWDLVLVPPNRLDPEGHIVGETGFCPYCMRTDD